MTPTPEELARKHVGEFLKARGSFNTDVITAFPAIIAAIREAEAAARAEQKEEIERLKERIASLEAAHADLPKQIKACLDAAVEQQKEADAKLLEAMAREEDRRKIGIPHEGGYQVGLNRGAAAIRGWSKP